MIFNVVLYPVLLTAFGVMVRGDGLYSQSTGGCLSPKVASASLMVSKYQ